MAVKVLNLDSGSAARFEREARIVAVLEHPSIVPIYDFGVDPSAYLVMRLLSGGTLADRLAAQGPLPLQELLKILRPIASALDYAHSRNVIHRDVKPSNIGFAEPGRAMLMDFGIAKLLQDTTSEFTSTGAIIGTPTYMAPEQITGEPITSNVDIYALGIVAFEALTNEVPFTGSNPYFVAFAHVNDPVPKITDLRQDLPPKINAIFSKVLAKDPIARYPTAIAFAIALEEVAADISDSIDNNIDSQVLSPRQNTPASRTTAIPRSSSQPWPTSPQSGNLTLRGLWQAFLLQVTSFFSKQKTSRGAAAIPETRNTLLLSDATLRVEQTQQLYPNGSDVVRPSIILRPQVHNLLAPVARLNAKELLSYLEPDRIVNYTIVYGGGGFILTGYGSFGGSSLIREISQLIEKEWSSKHKAAEEEVLFVHLDSNEVAAQSAVFDVYMYIVGQSHNQQRIGSFGSLTDGVPSDIQPLNALLDVLADRRFSPKDKSPLRRAIASVLSTRLAFERLVLTVDKVDNLDVIRLFLTHPVLQNPKTSMIAVVEREQLNRWTSSELDRLLKQSKVQLLAVPCLWESKSGLVDSTIGILFNRLELESLTCPL